MPLNRDQADAVMDLVEQCQAVNYAWLQTGYHADHVRSGGHIHNCSKTAKSKADCKKIGEDTEKHFLVRFDELQLVRERCQVLKVLAVDIDTILYNGLPGSVLGDLYRLDQAEQLESA